MSQNKKFTSLAGELKAIKEALSRFQKSHQIGRHREIMLDEPVNVLSLTNQSNVAFTDLDLSGYTSSGTGDISDKTFTIILNVGLSDSAGAASTPAARFRKNGTATTVGQFALSCDHGHNHVYYNQGKVGVDSNYILEYKLEAGGASTMNIDVWIAGYIEQL